MSTRMIANLGNFFPALTLGVGVLMISGMREQYAVTPRQPVATLSREFDGLTGTDVVIDDEEQRVAGMSSYALREFKPDSSTLFTVYVGYYDRQVQGKAIHSPKNCLPGAGWEILSTSEVAVPNSPLTGRVNRVLLANKGTKALVYYWYQGRGRIESNEYRVKWNLLRDAAVYGRTEESLVRIVVPVAAAKGAPPKGTEPPEVLAADAVAKRVAGKLAGEVSKIMPPAPGA